MGVSPLASGCIWSPNHYDGRAYDIEKITIHHMAGNMSAEDCGYWFQSGTRNASSNYGVGSDGDIKCYVDEDDAAWTSSSWDNDNRAVTIEVADYDTDEWSPSDAAYKSTINLVVDICRRNGIGQLSYTGDDDGTMTEHMMFASTSCPGPWWHARMGAVTDEINRRLRGEKEDDDLKPVNNQGGPVYRAAKGAMHIFTTSKAEVDNAVAKWGWKDEGIAFTAPKGGTEAVYRLYKQSNGDHFFTVKFEEADNACKKFGYVYEGVDFFGNKSGTPVYRLYQSSTGQHHYTADASERDKCTREWGWQYEGVAFYV